MAASTGRVHRWREQLRTRAPVLGLLGVVVAFGALSSVVALNTPAWESADEPGHVQNVESIVGGDWYRMDPGSGNEAHQPPLYYAVLAAWQRVVGEPKHSPDPGAYVAALEDVDQGVFTRHDADDHDFLLSLRLANIVLGIGTILLAYLIARAVSNDRWTPVVAAAVVAMVPRFIFLSAFVTNDNLATLLGAALTLLAVKFVLDPRQWRMALVGASLGLLVITKLSALPLAAALVIVVFARRGAAERLRALALGSFVAVGVCGWYLVQNALRYGDPLARRASERYLGPIGGLGTFGALDGSYDVADPLRQIVLRVPERIIETFWYSSGWNQFRWPWAASIPFWLLLGIALVGLVRTRPARRVVVTLGVIVATAFLSVWIVAFQTESFQPRLAFTGLAALATLAALGLQRWKVPLRFLLPLAGLVGALIAIEDDVLSVSWH